MSGTKFKYFILLMLFFSTVNAAVWQVSSSFSYDIKDGPLACLQNPAFFPDTLCLSSVYSPGYRKFGVYEGLIYIGCSRYDISLQTQYHPLMSNHQLSFGFPVLYENTIKAGLQFHYTLSALHGIDTRHKGSCSGGMHIHPHPDWTISLYSKHLLSFPRDSTEHLLEANSGCACMYSPLSEFAILLALQKRVSFPWQMIMGIYYAPWDILSCSIKYEIVEHQLEMRLNISPGRWMAGIMIRQHPFLGFSQQFMIAYVY